MSVLAYLGYYVYFLIQNPKLPLCHMGKRNPLVLLEHIRGTFDLATFKVILGSIGTFAIYRNMRVMIRDKERNDKS